MDWSSKRVRYGSVALLGMLAAAGIGSLIFLPPVQIAPGAAVPSQLNSGPTPSSTAFASAEYTGSATCENLIPESLLARLRGSGFDFFADYRTDALNQQDGWGSFTRRAAVVCGIGAVGRDAVPVTRYMYGEIDNVFILTDALFGKSYNSRPYKGCSVYDTDRTLIDFETGVREPTAEDTAFFDSLEIVAICDKFWVLSAGDDDGLIDQMIDVGKAEHGQS